MLRGHNLQSHKSPLYFSQSRDTLMVIKLSTLPFLLVMLNGGDFLVFAVLVLVLFQLLLLLLLML